MKKCFITSGPVIQSFVSLWKSLVEDLLCLTVFTKSAIVTVELQWLEHAI